MTLVVRNVLHVVLHRVLVLCVVMCCVVMGLVGMVACLCCGPFCWYEVCCVVMCCAVQGLLHVVAPIAELFRIGQAVYGM